MINLISYNKSMDSIKSYREALSFKKEAIDIPLDLLASTVPEDLVKLIKPQPFGIGIFTLDKIIPEVWLTNKDTFFTRDTTGNLQKIKPEPGMDPSKILYVRYEYGGATTTNRLYSLSAYFGNFVTLSRTERACRNILGVHSFYLYLQSLGLYEVYQDIRTPSIESIIPTLSMENWKNHKANDILEKLSKVASERPSIMDFNEDEPLVDESEYSGEVLKVIGPNISPVVKTFHEFYEFDRDCFYNLELRPHHLRLIKGIDHKFLPYYENKFADHSL